MASGFTAASARGGKTRRCARNSNVNAPTTPATVLADNTPNSTVPISVPSSPAGSNSRNSTRSRSRQSCCKPVASITSSSGNMIAAACGTGTASASSGVASDPKPLRKPLFESPITSTAGMAMR